MFSDDSLPKHRNTLSLSSEPQAVPQVSLPAVKETPSKRQSLLLSPEYSMLDIQLKILPIAQSSFIEDIQGLRPSVTSALVGDVFANIVVVRQCTNSILECLRSPFVFAKNVQAPKEEIRVRTKHFRTSLDTLEATIRMNAATSVGRDEDVSQHSY